MKEENETYLGDGLYVSHDGYQFKLRAPREIGDHVVYLDDRVVVSFLGYVGATFGKLIEVKDAAK